MNAIELKNINLTGISEEEQWNKIREENTEFFIALSNKDKENAIEEFWDCVQTRLGILQIRLGITAEEVQTYYPQHLEKIKSRPRTKKCSKCQGYSYIKEVPICIWGVGENRIIENENKAKECECYEE
jgi:phosphoribosyl-ATP pyrophosphohydrolase